MLHADLSGFCCYPKPPGHSSPVCCQEPCLGLWSVLLQVMSQATWGTVLSWSCLSSGLHHRADPGGIWGDWVGPKCTRAKELILPLAGWGIEWASLDRVIELTVMVWIQKSWQANQIRYHIAQIQGFDLLHLNLYSMWTPVLLEHAKGWPCRSKLQDSFQWTFARCVEKGYTVWHTAVSTMRFLKIIIPS